MKLLTRMLHRIARRERQAAEERLNTYQHYLENGELPDQESKIRRWWDFLQIKIGDLEKSVDGELERYRNYQEKERHLAARLS